MQSYSTPDAVINIHESQYCSAQLADVSKGGGGGSFPWHLIVTFHLLLLWIALGTKGLIFSRFSSDFCKLLTF